MNKYLSILIMFMALTLANTSSYAAVTGVFVNYKANDTSLIGYIAYDNAIKGKRPGVIIVPDWWGLGDFARDRANALAKMGYTAMVMDNYGNGTYVEPPDQAGALMNGFTENPKTMEVRFDATHQVLLKHKTVDSKHVAAIGYSLGGMVVLEMARRGRDLDGVASLWGVIAKTNNPAKKGFVKAKILVQQPAEDGWAPEKEVSQLKKEMAAAGVDVRVIVYANTKHGFSRPDATTRAKKYKLGIRYDAKADKKSWKDLEAFLKRSFK